LLLKKRKVSIALSSGSAKGIAHLGAIDALKEKKYEFEAISGSSAGAIAAALLAFDKTDEFKDWVLSLDKKKSLKLFDFNLLPTSGLINGNKIGKILYEFFGDKDIEDSPIPLYICATKISTGESVYFTKGKIVDVLRASIAIPGIFEPYKIKRTYYFDGAVSEPLPIKILFQEGYKRNIAIDLNYHIKGPPIKKIPNIFSSINSAINIFSKHVTCDKIYLKNCKKLIRPDLSDFGLFEFYRAEELIDKGYSETLKELD
jgi:NTE family protein